MRIVAAPASFKGSLSAREAVVAIALGVRDADPGATVDICPVGDGGEGTAEILARSCDRHEERWTRTVDALGRPIDARWFLVHDPERSSGLLERGTAILDAASCLGITLLDRHELNPEQASSAGLGEMLRAITEEGVGRIVVGLGGTATMDGGIGMAGALGWTFTDEAHATIEPIATNLAHVAKAIAPKEAFGAEVIVVCDVRAPLTGPTGAARVFGLQKGATPKQVERLDAGMHAMAWALGLADPDAPGAGAAGGLGWALCAFAAATLRPGGPAVIEAIGLADLLGGADLVISGEGAIDAQTGMGKGVESVCARAGELGVPVVAICGRCDGDRDAIARALGARAIVALTDQEPDPDRAMRDAARLVREASGRIVRERVGFCSDMR